MTGDEARRVLGVAGDASPDELRATFRRMLLRHHPDVAGDAGTVPTHRIVAAYRTLRSSPAPATVPSTRAGTAPVVMSAAEAFGETVVVAGPPREAFMAMLEVAHGLGEVAYVDGALGLLETIVVFEDYPVCSVVLNVQPAPAGRTMVSTAASCYVESLTGAPPPPGAAVAALVAERLRALTSHHRTGEP